MTTTDVIIENNKLIAEFMNLRKLDETGYDCAAILKPYPERTLDNNFHYDTETMSFATSWDWLLPVIDKISKYNEANHGAAMEDILPTWAVWSNDIDAMHTAVVDAIKSINEQENN